MSSRMGSRRIENPMGNAQRIDVSGKAGIKKLQYGPPVGRHTTVERREKSVRAVVDTSPRHRFKTKREVSKEYYTHIENVNSTGYFCRQSFEGTFNVSLYTFSSDFNIL